MKNNFNITIVKNTHSMAWWETAELIFYALKQLGFKVKIQHQFLDMDCVNIILGAFLLEKEYLNKLPKNSIILNTEQLLFESDFKKRGLEKFYKSVDVILNNQNLVYFYNPYKIICPSENCYVYNAANNILTHRDNTHLTIEGSLLLKNDFENFYNKNFLK